jgi:MFS family permease
VCLWGIACAAAAGATNYHSLLAARIFLGIFEASIAPCLMLISSQYYTKTEQAPRFAVWYSGLGFGQIIGGLVSFVFQHITNRHFKSWQAMFVFIGLATALIGIATFFILPDSPMTAKWLSDSEKAALLKHVSVNQTGVKNKHFKWEQGLEVLRDPQLWLMTICTICVSTLTATSPPNPADLSSDLCFQRRRYHLLCNAHPKLRFQSSAHSSP